MIKYEDLDKIIFNNVLWILDKILAIEGKIDKKEIPGVTSLMDLAQKSLVVIGIIMIAVCICDHYLEKRWNASGSKVLSAPKVVSSSEKPSEKIE